MGSTILEETKEDIHAAYKANSITKIGKETLYVFDRMVHFMLSNFKDRLKGITFESYDFDFDNTYLRSKKNMEHMLKIIEFIKPTNFPLSDFEFGKMKVDLERWYFLIGGKGMYFEYREDYLITPKMAAESLGVSNVTLNKYMKEGLENIDTTSHNKIPKHAVELWQDPVYAIRMQMLAQGKKIRNQTTEARLKEVRDEITELQKEYKAKNFEEAMVQNNIINIDDMDDPADFRNWQDLEEEYGVLLTKLIGESEFA